MKKAGTDPKVKKTLLRNYEQKVRSDLKPVVVSAGSSKETSCANKKELDQPTLCSSEALANYLSDVKKSVPPPLSEEDLKVSKSQLSAKITKKLNFHFNDRIYKNLVELNIDVANTKNKKDKKIKNISIKKDLEPNIEDFCHNEKEDDLVPNIPVLKHKFQPIRSIENGQLHRLVASFENL
ncbi:uncharacterized protein LOC123873743 [Maniola jurtina]|uniref:uncharacterized protein LOC123873743 n=1 Tax=Maniola jurtina TaxID=191418 RepID=UPI001E686A90|nr:uncharacterized protein LOC123873743 [Maniola jurtina]XP_045774722.1 uncharacterized protein LOC123873743 [Maniola jurtina]